MHVVHTVPRTGPRLVRLAWQQPGSGPVGLTVTGLARSSVSPSSPLGVTGRGGGEESRAGASSAPRMRRRPSLPGHGRCAGGGRALVRTSTSTGRAARRVEAARARWPALCLQWKRQAHSRGPWETNGDGKAAKRPEARGASREEGRRVVVGCAVAESCQGRKKKDGPRCSARDSTNQRRFGPSTDDEDRMRT
jgi:hypothetical protein